MVTKSLMVKASSANHVTIVQILNMSISKNNKNLTQYFWTFFFTSYGLLTLVQKNTCW